MSILNNIELEDTQLFKSIEEDNVLFKKELDDNSNIDDINHISFLDKLKNKFKSFIDKIIFDIKDYLYKNKKTEDEKLRDKLLIEIDELKECHNKVVYDLSCARINLKVISPEQQEIIFKLIDFKNEEHDSILRQIKEKLEELKIVEKRINENRIAF